jgi:hypothetical protein
MRNSSSGELVDAAAADALASDKGKTGRAAPTGPHPDRPGLSWDREPWLRSDCRSAEHEAVTGNSGSSSVDHLPGPARSVRDEDAAPRPPRMMYPCHRDLEAGEAVPAPGSLGRPESPAALTERAQSHIHGLLARYTPMPPSANLAARAADREPPPQSGPLWDWTLGARRSCPPERAGRTGSWKATSDP